VVREIEVPVVVRVVAVLVDVVVELVVVVVDVCVVIVTTARRFEAKSPDEPLTVIT
jgi:hypothetical protein